jgi:hypothetical protein
VHVFVDNDANQRVAFMEPDVTRALRFVRRLRKQAVAKDGRGKTRGSKSVARRAGNKKRTKRSTPILSSDRAEPSK